jgi:soluble lytic murein transglycosylase-like protein
MGFGSAGFWGGVGHAGVGAAESQTRLNNQREQDQTARLRAMQQAEQEANRESQARIAEDMRRNAAQGHDGMAGISGYTMGTYGEAPKAPAAPAGGANGPATTGDVRRPTQSMEPDKWGKLSELRAQDSVRNSFPHRALSAIGAISPGSSLDIPDTSKEQKKIQRQASNEQTDAAIDFNSALKSKLANKPVLAQSGDVSQFKGRTGAQSPLTLEGAVMHVESRGNMNAVSPKGAKSDMQVMDGTNRDPGFGVTPAQNASLEERSRVGKDYLRAMQKQFGNDTDALVAYNWGPGRAQQWIAAGRDPAQLPDETRNYVQQVLALAGGQVGAQPGDQRFNTPQVGAQPGDPAVAAMPPGQVQAYTVQGGQGFMPPGSSFDMQAAQRQAAMLQSVINNANPRTQQGFQMMMDAQVKLEGLKLQSFRSSVGQLTQAAASGDDVALSKLGQVFARETGGQIQIVRGPNNMFAFANAQGQLVGQPMTREAISRHMYGNLDSSLVARAMQLQLEAQGAGMKAREEAQGKLGPELEKIRAETQRHIAVAKQNGVNDLLLKKLENEANSGKGTFGISNTDGSMFFQYNDGRPMVQVTPGAMVNGVQTSPSLRPVR